LGEIRDGATAHEVLKASLSMFVISTIHASSVTEALERYVMFCEEISPAAKANIASTLYVLTHQKMRVNPVNNQRQVDISGFNLRHINTAATIRAKIAAGQFNLQDQFSSTTYNFED
ncbi:MAG: hypothetical protein E6663_14900, partial [Staphylococcus lugdunensis]|nr:hypothetical protein [Staphylococcus lugdunensis]